jgi:hypothetical protein
MNDITRDLDFFADIIALQASSAQLPIGSVPLLKQNSAAKNEDSASTSFQDSISGTVVDGQTFHGRTASTPWYFSASHTCLRDFQPPVTAKWQPRLGKSYIWRTQFDSLSLFFRHAHQVQQNSYIIHSFIPRHHQATQIEFIPRIYISMDSTWDNTTWDGLTALGIPERDPDARPLLLCGSHRRLSDTQVEARRRARNPVIYHRKFKKSQRPGSCICDYTEFPKLLDERLASRDTVGPSESTWRYALLTSS